MGGAAVCVASPNPRIGYRSRPVEWGSGIALGDRGVWEVSR